jgi:hypothetical protein
MVFDEEDIMFATSHDLVHTAFWGKAEVAIKEIKRRNESTDLRKILELKKQNSKRCLMNREDAALFVVKLW